MTVTPAHIAPALVLALIVWRGYGRIRRDMGKQLLRLRRITVRIALFTMLSLLIAIMSRDHPSLLTSVLSGLLLGVPLALLGLRLTRFETTPEGRFYTPNTYIGIALSLLLITRLFYRLPMLFHTSGSFSLQSPGSMQNPVTLFILGLLASYYSAYNIGVLVLSREPV